MRSDDPGDADSPLAHGGGAVSVELRAAAADYLAGLRARGYRLADHDWILRAFLDGLDARGVRAISIADAMAFATSRPGTQRRGQAARLRAVRGLAAYVHGLDPAAAQLIPAGLITAKVSRRIPYLYTGEQISALMAGALDLSPAIFAASMHTLIGLIAVTGLRSGEAFTLDVQDLDVERAVLTVTGKYGKRRLVPLHPSTVQALTRYQRVRCAHAAPTGALFLGAKGGRLNANTARAAFRALVDAAGLPARPGCPTGRLHDLRHGFAVDTLIDAHRQGVDLDARIAALATYLGHVDPVNTFWYLTASPELMAAVRDRITAQQRPGRS